MESSTAFKSVAVIGAGGKLGKLVTTALLSAGFTVVALTRAGSSTPLPDGVAAVRQVDFTSLEDLVGALAGQDAVVSVIGTMAVAQQKVLVEAAAQAKVKRFLPSEFGLNTRGAGLRDTKLGRMLKPKMEMVDRLMELAEKSHGAFTWTGVGNNLFFDSSLEAGLLGIDIPSRKATIVDSGSEPFSTSNRQQVAWAVVSVLQRPEETANRYLMVQSFVTTQNQLLKVVCEELEAAGKDKEFQVERITAAKTEQIADEALAGGKAFDAFWAYVRQYQFTDGAGRALKGGETANQLLGLQEEDLRESVRAVLKDIANI
ncbi:NAD(P)-binding protein [Apiospora arundinis]|uniref:NmrA-like family protein n=1 Tax=Apiospora arundinis TaxID=335852 RepID=A0ABR2I3B8_9PEZI